MPLAASPRQVVEKQDGMPVHDGLSRLDLSQTALEGCPTHALWFDDVAVHLQAAAQLEEAPERPIILALALTGIAEPVSTARGKGECARR